MSSFITYKKSQSFPWAEHPFFDKIQNGRQEPCWSCNSWDIFDIYIYVIPHFNMIFYAEFISEASSNY